MSSQILFSLQVTKRTSMPLARVNRKNFRYRAAKSSQHRNRVTRLSVLQIFIFRDASYLMMRRLSGFSKFRLACGNFTKIRKRWLIESEGDGATARTERGSMWVLRNVFLKQFISLFWIGWMSCKITWSPVMRLFSHVLPERWGLTYIETEIDELKAWYKSSNYKNTAGKWLVGYGKF